MPSSLKPFVVKFYDKNSVFRVRQVKARDGGEAEARIRRAVPGSFGHHAQIEPALKHLHMGALYCVVT
jgi:hypothetical protein